MIKKIMLASCLLVASMASHAALISYNGYERDTAKNYVTGGGLEWLMWDLTNGKSIKDAIDKHGVNGWKLASNNQMTSLFTAFQFPDTIWNANENETQTSYTAWTPDETGQHRAFLQLFGMTDVQRVDGSNDQYDYYESTMAIYGDDADLDGYYNVALVNDDHTDRWGFKYLSVAQLATDNMFNRQRPYLGYGVALVREVRAVPPAQVSLPGSLSLLALGLVAFGVRRRQVSRR